MNTTYLYRPVNQAELDLIAALNWRGFPPRLPDQPIFYPVMNEQYAREITEKWNVPAYGKGYVVRWAMESDYLSQFNVENVGGHHHDELWVPAGQLDDFNQHIVGTIEAIAEYGKES